MNPRTALAALFILPLLGTAQEELPRNLRTLPPAPKGGRFELPQDLVWPAQTGEADV